MITASLNQITKSLSPETLESLDPEDPARPEEELRNIIDEADGTHALSFLRIHWNANTDKLSWDPTVLDECAQVVSAYLDLHDFDGTPNPGPNPDFNEWPVRIQQIARNYDRRTAPFRGADDGTFDYAGSYVELIIDALKDFSKKSD